MKFLKDFLNIVQQKKQRKTQKSLLTFEITTLSEGTQYYCVTVLND